jgi:hypothetical protein
MKKQVKKLVLARETVRVLEGLDSVRGGSNPGSSACQASASCEATECFYTDGYITYCC